MLSETDDKLVLMFADFIFSKLNTHFFEHELDSYIEKAEKLREKRISRAQGRDYRNLLVFNTLARCEMNAYLSFMFHNPQPSPQPSSREEGDRGENSKKTKSKKKSGKKSRKRKNNKERLVGTAVDLYLKDELRKTNYYRKKMLKFDVLLKYRVDDFLIVTEADLLVKKNYLIELKHSKELRHFDFEHLNFLSLFTSNVFVINTYSREVFRFEQTERERQELIEKLDRVVKAVKTQNPASLRPNLAFCWFCDRKFSCPIFRSMRQISSKL